MTTPSELPDSELLNVAELVALKVSRPILQEALLESRLIARTADREEVRRIARNHTTWTALVRSCLENQEKRVAALRAIRLLVNAYLKLPSIDHRVENSFRKAHQAAERGDTQRLQREIERLAEFGAELGIVELKNPVIILSMGAASEHAREHIACLNPANAIDRELEPETLRAEPKPTPPPAHTDTKSITGAASLTPEASPTSHITVTPSPKAETGLLADLRALAQTLPPPQPLEWNIAELLNQEPLPPSCIPWPTTTAVTNNLKGLQQAARKLANAETAQNDLPIERVRLVRTALQDALALLGQAPNLLDDLAAIDQTIRETATAHAEALDGTAKADAQRSLALLDGDASAWAQGIIELDESTKRNYAAHEAQRTAILDITRTIASLTSELPIERHSIIETKVRFLARRQRLEELRKIHDESVQELVTIRALRARIQTIAAKAIEAIVAFAERRWKPPSCSSRCARWGGASNIGSFCRFTWESDARF